FDDLKIEYTLVTDTSDPRPLDTLERSVIGIKTTSSTGSGFIISSSGYILTNNHVVDGYDKVSIVFSNGVEAEGTVIRSAPARDVALIKIPLNNLSQLSLNKQLPKVGSQAYAMGAPKGLEFQGTLSSGIISAIRNNANGHPLIQSDTNITFGNSGGPMFDSNGHVIGISVSISKIVDFANYFIPIESALATLNIQSN
ncbi:MAG: trypsin-like serine protease, partial [Kordiimonadaceae bacterium]|nr:trypsin-like serine protease [Kordiimonadaceae bacterium]